MDKETALFSPFDVNVLIELGAFLYSRTPTMTPGMLQMATKVIRQAGLNPNDFCVIRNQCFLSEQPSEAEFKEMANTAAINKQSSGSANKFSYSSAAVAATGVPLPLHLHHKKHICMYAYFHMNVCTL